MYINMRQFPILLIACMMAAMFVGCEQIGSTDPQHDTTRLWPAYDWTADQWGYINHKGKMVIPAQFDEVNFFSCGYALVEKNDMYHYINTDGTIVYTIDERSKYDGEPFYYNYVVMKQGGRRYGLMNKNFEYVIQPTYANLREVADNGLLAMAQKVMLYSGDSVNVWGYLNTKGEQVIPAKYTYVRAFSDGFACVSDTKGWGVIDAKGKEVIPCQYPNILYVGGDMFVTINKSFSAYTLMDAQGDELYTSDIRRFVPAVDNELIGIVNNDGLHGYMDFDRNIRIACQYDYAMPFFEGYAFVEKEINDDYITQVIDTKGQVLCTLPDDSEPETGFHNGLALIVVDMGEAEAYRYITPKGEIIYQWLEDEVPNCSPVRRLAERYSNTTHALTLTAEETSVDGDMQMSALEEFTEQTNHFSSRRLEQRRKHACDPSID